MLVVAVVLPSLYPFKSSQVHRFRVPLPKLPSRRLKLEPDVMLLKLLWLGSSVAAASNGSEGQVAISSVVPFWSHPRVVYRGLLSSMNRESILTQGFWWAYSGLVSLYHPWTSYIGDISQYTAAWQVFCEWTLLSWAAVGRGNPILTHIWQNSVDWYWKHDWTYGHLRWYPIWTI